MKLLIFTIIFIICYLQPSPVNSLAVMSVDFGSEWMKVGIVSPGVPMEIALNKESKRKSPAVISFRDNVRLFGEDAQTIGLRFPNQAYFYLLDLLGKSINHPLVKLYQQRFPYFEIVSDPERDTILFKHDETTFYSPEELIAQMLFKAKEFAESGAQQPIKECVLTVPGFFNQIERKALLQSAQLAGLKVLQLINDYTAVALNYGIFRSKTFNETAQYVMFYDMGASSTTATLISYQTIKTKEKGYVETHPQLSVLGVGYDRTLGGLEIQLRLRDHLAKKFNEMKKTKTDVFKNPRALAKLFKEAGRLKNVLSANNEHYAQVEGLLDEQDFKVLVSREDLEGLIPDFVERVAKPVETALKTAHLTMDVVNQVVLVGAGTRVPKVQEVLQQAVGKDLAKNLNTDEAATMGAVYKAADLSTGFKVTKFITKDAVIFPIQITFHRETDDGTKNVKRTLFGLMNPYPQKKIITFNKHTDDFSFNVNYADLDYLQDKEILNVGSTNLSEYQLTGVAAAIKKHLGDNVESKGIKAHFNMDESGILNLVNVELVVEKMVIPSDEEEGTLSKLGSTFSKLFGGDDKPAEKLSDEKPVHEDVKETEEDTKPDTDNGKTTPDNNKKQQNTTESNNTTTTKDAPTTKEKKPKIVTVKEPIEASETTLTVNVLNPKQVEESIEKIKKLDKIEAELTRRATALNNLESFIIDVQNKLYEDEFTQAATNEEVENIKKVASEISDWLYDDGSDADADTYEKKLDDFQALTRELFARVWEHKERPEALNALRSMLNHSSHFLNTAKNLTSSTNPEKDVFTDVEVQSLDKLIKETVEWKQKMIKEQEKQKLSDPIRMTVKHVMDKMGALDREVKYLLNKIKLWRPKKVEKPVENKTETANDTTPITDSDKEEVVIEKEDSDGEQPSEHGDNKEEKLDQPEVDDRKQTEDAKKEKIKPTKRKDSDSENHTEL